MKNTFITILMLFLLKTAQAQTISPLETAEFCPNTEIVFTVIVPGYNPNVSTGIGGCLVTMSAYNIKTASDNSSTTFNFKGRFNDVNQKQVFQVNYLTRIGSGQKDFVFKNIKSLNIYTPSGNCPGIYIKSDVIAPMCKITSVPINFDAVKWSTAFENPAYCFGSISTYEYILPPGWSMNGVTSNGTTPIVGNNNVTVTSDLNTGGVITVRPANNCGTGLSNGQPFVPIYISRPQGFVLEPANVSITCGSVAPITFTVKNVNSTTDVTNHSWNLGAVPNGWLLPDGSAAPEYYSTGAANTLTLTPVCGAKQNNISATVTTNGFDCSAGASNVSIAMPQMLIEGDEKICVGSSNYSIQGLPCNSIVTWSASPTGLVSYIANGNTLNVTRIGNGHVILNPTAKACGLTSEPVKNINVGLVDLSRDKISITNGQGGKGYFCSTMAGNEVQILDPSITIGEVLLLKSPEMSVLYRLYGYMQFGYVPKGYYVLRAKLINACGEIMYEDDIESKECKGWVIESKLSASPNPAASTININTAETTQEDYEIQLYDLYNSKPVLTQKAYKGSKKMQVQVSHLRRGQYILVLKNKKGEIVKKKQMILN